jgi:hypothetical protein
MQEFHRKLVGISGPLAMQGFFLNPTYLLRKRTDFCNITVFPISSNSYEKQGGCASQRGPIAERNANATL